MAKGYLRFVGERLNTVRALRLFADFADEYRDHVGIFNHTWIRPLTNLTANDVLIQLLVDDLPTKDPARPHLDAFKEFCDIEPDIPDPRRVNSNDGADRLLEKLPTLLETKANGNQRLRAGSARQLENEKLFVIPVDAIQARLELDDPDAIVDPDAINDYAYQIFSFFQFHATSLKVATPVVTSHSDRFLPEMVYFFHLMIDKLRGASPVCEQAIVQYPDGLFLDCYETTRNPKYRVAVSTKMVPDSEALDHFCRLMLNIAGLLGNKTPHHQRHDMPFLAAVYVQDEHLTRPPDQALAPDQVPASGVVPFAGEDLLVDLGSTRFVEDWWVRSPLASLKYTPVSMSSDPAKDGIAELKKYRDRSDTYYGFRLRLENSRYLTLGEKEKEAVTNELTRNLSDIRFKLTELENTGQSFPRLLRFRPDQLGALMDVLRTFSAEDLKRLRYAFQASNPYPEIPVEFEFSHYILIDGIVNKTGLTLLNRHKPTPQVRAERDRFGELLTEIKTVPCHEFWFDPFWATMYRNQRQSSYLFVPYQTRLSPPLHVWDKDKFDPILKDYLETAFKENPGWKQPENPIYLFDGDLHDPDILTLTVLDDSDFKSILTLDVIPLINDNVNIVQSIGVEKMVRILSKKISENRILTDFETDISTRRRDFKQSAYEYAVETAQITANLTGELAGALNDLVTDATQMIVEANELNEWLKKAREAADEMRQQQKELENSLARTTRQAKQLDNVILDQIKQVEQSIESAIQQRKNMLDDIHLAAEEIKQTRTDLETQLGQLHNLILPAQSEQPVQE